MEIQSLIRERVIGNIKIGKKGKNGIPQKLTYFNVEQDKATKDDVVEVFKQLYPGKPEKLRIRFTTENPFSCKFKKYVNGKATCIGNGEKAITKLLGHSSIMVTFKKYTDKNAIIQDCLEYIEPFIERGIESEEMKTTDCTDIETDIIMQEYYKRLVA